MIMMMREPKQRYKYFVRLLQLVGGQARTWHRFDCEPVLSTNFLSASLFNLYLFFATSFVKRFLHLFICKFYFFLYGLSDCVLSIHLLEYWWIFSPFCIIYELLYTIVWGPLQIFVENIQIHFISLVVFYYKHKVLILLFFSI